MVAQGVKRVGKTDQVAGDEPSPLVDELVERMLAVGPRLAPVNGAGRIGNPAAVQRDRFAVTLHRQLLQICGEALEVLVIRQDGDRFRAEEVGVPDGQEPEQDRQIALERSGAEMLVHRVEAGEHRAEVVGADRDHRRQADGRIHRVTAADPVPEPKHVRRVDAEFAHFLVRWSKRRRNAWRPPARL